MKLLRPRWVIGSIIVAVSGCILAWGYWPVDMESRVIQVAPGELQFPFPGHVSANQEKAHDLGEARQLVTEWPALMRVGDSATLLMALVPSEKNGGVTEWEEYVEQDQKDDPASPSAVVPYQPVAQSRLELPGLSFQPPGEINEAIFPEKSVRFLWHVRTAEAGTYPGTIWLYIRYLPQGEGAEARKVIAAQTVNIRVVRFLGLSGNMARIVGPIGFVVGSMVLLDFFSAASTLVFHRKPGDESLRN